VCNSKIEPHTNSFILVFGSDDCRKKAHFCAVDCMEYFIAHLKFMKKQEELQ
jgi:hypothetical protein